MFLVAPPRLSPTSTPLTPCQPGQGHAPALRGLGRVVSIMVLAGTGLLAQAPAHAQQANPAAAPTAQASRPSRAPTKPAWSELTPAQREALAPLAAQWETFSEPHKRKWVALVGNYQRMPPAEQQKLQSRMAEWLALCPSQSTEARLNFGETQQLSADEKKAKWEAYQALPAEEKRKLAASAVPKPPATAAAVRPVPPQKLASVPRSVGSDAKPARIVVAPAAEAGATPGVAPGTAATAGSSGAGPAPASPTGSTR